MAGRSDIKAGSAFVELYLKQGALTKGLLAAKKQLQSFGGGLMSLGGSLAGLGSAVLSPLGAAVSHFVSSGSALNDMSARTGVAAGQLAELKFAAEQTGASLEDVEIGLKTMTKKGFKAADFDKIAKSITEIEDPSERAAKSLEIFGKAGTKLLPMMADLAALRKQAQDLGLVPTDEAVQQADALGDKFDQVKSVILASVFEIGAALAPVLMPAIDTIKNIAVTVGKWVRENGQLIRTIAMVAAGLTAAGVVIAGIGATIFGLGTLAGIIAGAIGTVGTVIAALTSPIGLLTAAVVAGVTAWALWTESGRAAVQAVIGFFAPLLETARKAIGGIADALMAGKLMLAAQIAGKSLQLVFMQALQAIAGMIGGTLGNLIATIGTDLLQGDLLGAWNTVVGAMAVAWDAFVAGSLAVFAAFAKAVFQIWNGVTKTIMKSMSGLAHIAAKYGGPAGKAVAGGLMSAQAGLRMVNEPIKATLGGASAAAGAAAAIANQKSLQSGADFGKKLQEGADEAKDATQTLAAELDALRAEAAAAKDAAFAAPQLAAPGSGFDLGGEKSTVTFSGAGLLAAGQGGGPGQQLVKIGKEHNQKLGVIHQDLIRLADKPALVMGN